MVIHKKEIVDWLNKKIPEHREELLGLYTGQLRKKLAKAFHEATKGFVPRFTGGSPVTLKLFIKWEFEDMFKKNVFYWHNSDMSKSQIQIFNTTCERADRLLREMSDYFNLGVCK